MFSLPADVMECMMKLWGVTDAVRKTLKIKFSIFLYPMCEGLMAGFSQMGASRIGEKTPSATQKVSLKGPKLYLSLEVHLVEGVVGT